MSGMALAMTVGDPGANFLPGLRRLQEPLRRTFAGGGAVITDHTHHDVVDFVESELRWPVQLCTPDGRVGLHRRQSVELALGDADAVLYSDADHILRWLEAAPEEVSLVADATEDFVVVGRSTAAMDASPARLRDTESLVNHVYRLMTGHPWDLMFAIRRLTRDAAVEVIVNCTEDSIANDVEWPLHAERAGMSLGYFESDHLHYRARADFDAASDEHDHDPAKWISRIEIAGLHTGVLKRFLPET